MKDCQETETRRKQGRVEGNREERAEKGKNEVWALQGRGEKSSQFEPPLGEEITQAFGKVTNVYMLIC